MAPAETELTPERVREMVAGGATLIDVRRPDEVSEGRIEGSRHIELPDVAAQAATIEREAPVVFYCRVGSRSALAVEAFRGGGYDAYNLAGGIEAWAAAGLPVADDS